MPAYMIIHATIRDREKFMSGYAPAAAKLVERFGGRYLLMARDAEVLTGDMDPGASVVISQWPDKETAMRFWRSDEYAEVKRSREGIAEVRVVLVEGPPVS